MKDEERGKTGWVTVVVVVVVVMVVVGREINKDGREKEGRRRV